MTTNPSAPPITVQATITPPVASPWVPVIVIRDPPGVVYQDISSGSVLSVALSLASGGLTPCTAASLAVLSSSRQIAALIPSMVPPVSNAAAQTGVRAASQARSCSRIAARPAGDALANLARCTASIRTSTFSVLSW